MRFLQFLCGLVGILLTTFASASSNMFDDGYSKELNMKFVIVVASYNNEKFFKKNLKSIFSQTYENYRVIYVDDCSTDQTELCVRKAIQKYKKEDKVTFIRNKNNRKALRNLYDMIHMCADDEIVVVLDGDDWFAHERVLERLNHVYADNDVWLTYGRYLQVPTGQPGCSKAVDRSDLINARVRELPWQFSHLRTFYAGLFKRIEMKDLFLNGGFFDVTYDLAIMYPMLEMAREHTYFIPDILYVYNYENPLNDEKLRREEQMRIETILRGLPKYDKLVVAPSMPIEERLSDDSCDILLFSYNRPMQLYALLESIEKNVSGYQNLYILYRSELEFQSGYELVKGAFPNCEYIQQPSDNAEEKFQGLVNQTVFAQREKSSEYIIFGVDDMIITDHIDLKKDMNTLSKSGAYGLFYRLGENVDYCYTMDIQQGVPDIGALDGDFRYWTVGSGKGDWAYPRSLDFVLYKKDTIKDSLQAIHYRHPNLMEGEWSKTAPMNVVGICPQNPKMLNIPVNIVSTFKNKSMHEYNASDLNTMFLEGWRISSEEFFHFRNRAAHVEVELPFRFEPMQHTAQNMGE